MTYINKAVSTYYKQSLSYGVKQGWQLFSVNYRIYSKIRASRKVDWCVRHNLGYFRFSKRLFKYFSEIALIWKIK